MSTTTFINPHNPPSHYLKPGLDRMNLILGAMVSLAVKLLFEHYFIYLISFLYDF